VLGASCRLSHLPPGSGLLLFFRTLLTFHVRMAPFLHILSVTMPKLLLFRSCVSCPLGLSLVFAQCTVQYVFETLVPSISDPDVNLGFVISVSPQWIL